MYSLLLTAAFSASSQIYTGYKLSKMVWFLWLELIGVFGKKIFKYGNIQYIRLTPNKELNFLTYTTSSYVIICD